eukprot:363770-Chlamydomonas_euryale.AAC.14
MEPKAARIRSRHARQQNTGATSGKAPLMTACRAPEAPIYKASDAAQMRSRRPKTLSLARAHARAHTHASADIRSLRNETKPSRWSQRMRI